MAARKRAVLLVGHGGVPTDYPHESVTRLKRLEGQRRTTGGPPTAEELELDQRIRRWPRSPETDPYQAGLQALAERLRQRLAPVTLALAYNEFCSPTIAEAVADLVAAGTEEITVVPSMLTPGGSHSEVEIPAALADLRRRYPSVTLTYAWPFDLSLVGTMLAEHLRHFHSGTSRP
jgi:sirohydrochlorin cobaltochelatase